MFTNDKKSIIQLPNKECIDRKFDNALVMEREYQEKYVNLVMNDTRVGILLAYVISEMDEKNELISDFGTIAVNLNWSKTTVARAVKTLKEQYSDLIVISKFHNVSKFTIDKTKCFKSIVSE